MGREDAEEHFYAASMADPCNAWPHFNLGTIRTKKGDYDGAEWSYGAVVQVDPHDQLARLLYDKIRQQKAQGEFWGQIVAMLQEHPQIEVSDTGLLDMPPGESGHRAKARLEGALMVVSTWAPVRLVMNLDRISERHLEELLFADANGFQKACDGVGRYADKFPAALQQIRDLENSTKWLIPWAVERLKYF